VDIRSSMVCDGDNEEEGIAPSLAIIEIIELEGLTGEIDEFVIFLIIFPLLSVIARLGHNIGHRSRMVMVIFPLLSLL
jgi:hypothetical protein